MGFLMLGMVSFLMYLYLGYIRRILSRGCVVFIYPSKLLGIYGNVFFLQLEWVGVSRTRFQSDFYFLFIAGMRRLFHTPG
ncbi:hypothetical protein BIY28_20155 [Brenneria goodwinii]|nr:hypothetical protein BIY28_20155 [Brenneria goodwinii]